MDQGEGMEGTALKEDPLDFALWKAQKPMEDTCLGRAVGRGRPGWHIECSAMAEATLGAPIEIHGGGNDLIFPHHENEAAQTLAARGHELARIWMHNGMLQLGSEKMSKSVGNIRALAEVLDEVGRDTLVRFFSEGHYRQPLAFPRERLDDAARRVERIRDAGRRLAPGESPEALAPHRDAFFDALADDYNTPRALAALADWIREANRADGPVGDGAPARDARRCSGWRTCSTATRGHRPRSSSWPSSRARRARRAISRRPTACATSCGRAAGRSATAPSGQELVSRSGRDRLRPQRGPGGASAARGACGPCGRRRARPREFPGARSGARPRRSRGAAGSDGHQGVCADVEEYRYADAAELLRAPDPVLVALDEVTDPQNLGAICRSAEVTGATGVILPERRSAAVTPAVCKASAGAVEHLPSRRSATSPTSSPRPRRPAAGATAPRSARAPAYRSVDWRGGIVLVLGAEGRGLRPRVAAACDELVGLPLRGRIGRST